MTTPLVIIGCGGFGREVHDVVDAINQVEPRWSLIGYVDESPAAVNTNLVEARGSRILGGLGWFADAPPNLQYVIGIGSGTVRRRIDEQLSSRGIEPAVLVHPAATMGHDIEIGAGSVVCAGVRATNHISLGRHVHLNLNSTIGHDCALQDYVTINPLVAISGWVAIGEEAMIGTHSAVLQNLSVGPRSVVGAGSCVVKPVPTGAVVKGVPAR